MEPEPLAKVPVGAVAMRFMEYLIRWWGQAFCGHHWVRARWDDGSYGMRCQYCLKPYAYTWNDVITQVVPKTEPTPALPRPAASPAQRWGQNDPGEELKSLRRAA